jgi:hypothetical protein
MATPTDLIQGLFNSNTQGKYRKIISELSFTTVPNIQANQYLLMQIHTLPIVWHNVSLYWHVFKVDQIC